MKKVTKITFAIFAFISTFFFANAGELLIMLIALYVPTAVIATRIDATLEKIAKKEAVLALLENWNANQPAIRASLMNDFKSK